MRVAAIGDHFIKNEIIQRVFEEYLSPYFKLQWEVGTAGWPEDTQRKGEEVKEYVGSEEDVVKVAKKAEILIIHLSPVTKWVMQNCPHLRAIACCRGGPVNVNVEAATQASIPVFYAPGRNAVATAEFTVGLILSLVKRTFQAHIQLRGGNWCDDLFYRYDNAPEEVCGKRVGIIGFGNVGQKVCKILLSFGTEALVHDPYVDPAVIREAGAVSSGLDSLLRESDIVTLHARVTENTRGLMGPREFSLMRRTAYFINAARGPLVDYDALYKVLKNGRIAGAALDTYDPEPLPSDHPLLKMENVVSTPHIGGSSRETVWRGLRTLAKGVLNYLQFGEFLNCVNVNSFR